MAPTTMSPAPALPLTGDEALARFRDLLPSFRSAMLVTHALDGAEPHARPMGLVGDAAAFDGTLWFFSDDRSRKIAESTRGRGLKTAGSTGRTRSTSQAS